VRDSPEIAHRPTFGGHLRSEPILDQVADDRRGMVAEGRAPDVDRTADAPRDGQPHGSERVAVEPNEQIDLLVAGQAIHGQRGLAQFQVGAEDALGARARVGLLDGKGSSHRVVWAKR
jgi:hypothetical protein